MHEYYLTQSIKQLGLYNKSVKNLKSYISSQEYMNSNEKINEEIDPMKFDSQSIIKIKDENTLDIADVDMYSVDFDLDIHGRN